MLIPKEVNDVITTELKEYNLIKLSNNIFQLNMNTQAELCLTFLRFQEFYESPEYKGKYFSWEEYIQWYSSTQSKDKINFDYHKSWNGFNIPSSVLKPFIEGKFNLTKREESFLKLFKNIKGDFYIIGTHKEKDENYYKGLLKHETAHGMFFLSPEYKEEVLNILKNKKLDPIHTILDDLGYHKDVHLDEIHAYLMCEQEFLKKKNINVKEYKELMNDLNKVFCKELNKTNKKDATDYLNDWNKTYSTI